MHPESGPCLSVQGCKLPLAVLSQDEACRLAHETVQAKVERRLPNLQTAYCTLLLPREDVSGGKMSCPVLPEHQAEVAPATDAAETSECRYDEAKNGTNECAESKHKQLGRGKCASKEHRKFIDASTTAAATTTAATTTATTSTAAATADDGTTDAAPSDGYATGPARHEHRHDEQSWRQTRISTDSWSSSSSTKSSRGGTKTIKSTACARLWRKG